MQVHVIEYLLPPLLGDASLLTQNILVLAVLLAFGPSGMLAPAGATCSQRRCDAINNRTLGLTGVRVVPQLLEGELVANTCKGREFYERHRHFTIISPLGVGYYGGMGQRGCMPAAATGNLVIFTEWQDKFGCTVIGGLLETAVQVNSTAIVEKVLEQYLAHDRTLEFSRDKDAYNLTVGSSNAEMVDIVAG